MMVEYDGNANETSREAELQKELLTATPNGKRIIKAQIEDLHGAYRGGDKISRTPDSKKVVKSLNPIKKTDQPIPMILMGKIRSVLRNEQIITFFDDYLSKNIEKEIIVRYQNDASKDNHYQKIENWERIVQFFYLQTSGVFFQKISGNGRQDFLGNNPPSPFAGNQVFLLSWCMPPNVRNDALSIVRAIMDFGFGEDIQDKYKVTPKLLTRPIRKDFWSSMNFLAQQAVQQIPEFFEYFKTGLKSYDFENSTLCFNKDDASAVLLNKKRGDEFGAILSLNVEERTIVKYFIKAYTGYPAKRCICESGYVGLSNFLISSTTGGTVPFYVPCLREPFVYKVLESLYIGPTTAFVVNPYIYGGFFIATKGLTNASQTFMEIEKIDKLLVEKIHSMQQQDYNSFTVNLTLLDLLSTIMGLHDLNQSNFGFVLSGSGEFQETDFRDKISELVPFIIDFRVGSFDEEYTVNIGNNFLSGTHQKYKYNSLMSIVLSNQTEKEKKYIAFQSLKKFQKIIRKARPLAKEDIGEITFNFVTFGDDVDDFQLKQILNQKCIEIKSLMFQQRGIDDKPEETILKDPVTGKSRTNAELIGFKLGKSPKESDISDISEYYLDDALEELDNYCQNIICNYKTLKKYIINEYDKYFEQHNTAKVELTPSS